MAFSNLLKIFGSFPFVCEQIVNKNRAQFYTPNYKNAAPPLGLHSGFKVFSPFGSGRSETPHKGLCAAQNEVTHAGAARVFWGHWRGCGALSENRTKQKARFSRAFTYRLKGFPAIGCTGLPSLCLIQPRSIFFTSFCDWRSFRGALHELARASADFMPPCSWEKFHRKFTKSIVLSVMPFRPPCAFLSYSVNSAKRENIKKCPQMPVLPCYTL